MKQLQRLVRNTPSDIEHQYNVIMRYEFVYITRDGTSSNTSFHVLVRLSLNPKTAFTHKASKIKLWSISACPQIFIIIIIIILKQKGLMQMSMRTSNRYNFAKVSIAVRRPQVQVRSRGFKV